MRKVIFTLLFICAFIGQALAGKAFASTQNFVTSGTTTHTYNSTPSAPPRAYTFNYSSGAYSIDESFSTYQGLEYGIGDGSHGEDYTYTMTSEHNFSVARNLTQIKYRLYAYSNQGGAGGNTYTMHVEYKTGGSWYTLSGSYFTALSGQDEPLTKDTGTVTYSTPINSVSAVRATVSVRSWTTEGSITGKAYIYEIEAFGTAYDDIGLKARVGSTTYKIGVETLSTHKLRIRKGSTTYGIPLLATNDPEASPVRINDGASVKALPKATE